MTWGNAACLGMDPGIFQADEPTYNQPLALATCNRCPVKDPCLVATMKHETSETRRVGISGGTTPQQRAMHAGDKVGARQLAAAERKETWQQLYDAGRTDKEIADATWCTTQGISAWRRRLGLGPNGDPPERCVACGGHCHTGAKRCLRCYRESIAASPKPPTVKPVKPKPPPVNHRRNNTGWQNNISTASVARLVVGDIPEWTTRAERKAAVDYLISKGMLKEQVATRLRMHTRTVERLHEREAVTG